MLQLNQDEVKKFSRDLINEDAMGSILRGHLHVERLLISFVQGQFKRPLKKLDSFRFHQYVTIAAAQGLPEEFVGPLRKLGDLRNDFAHKMGAELTKTAARELITSLPPKLRKGADTAWQNMIETLPAGTNPPNRVLDAEPRDMFAIFTLVLWTDLSLHNRIVASSKLGE